MGVRRKTLLEKDVFDADCEEFHDYYLKHLKYDFRADWVERKKKKREQKKGTKPG